MTRPTCTVRSLGCPAKSSPLVPRTSQALVRTYNEAFRIMIAFYGPGSQNRHGTMTTSTGSRVPAERAEAVPRTTVAVSGCLGWFLSKEMGFSVLFLASLRGAGCGMLSAFNRLYHPRPSRILFGLIHLSLLFALAGLSCSSAICSHPHSPQAVTLYRSHRKPQLPHVDGLNPGISEPPSAAASEAATQTRTRGHSEPPRVR